MKMVDHQSPFTEPEEGEIAPGARKSNNNGRICEVCGKRFSSKKALRGHMRVHLNSQKNPAKMIENDEVSEIGDRKITTTSCKLCGKRFSSLRSLCGHMRCHPERERRGKRPPEELIKSGGCSENPLSSSSYETELDDNAYGAACALMLIATGEERYRTYPKDKKENQPMSSKKRKRNEVKRVVFDVDLNEVAADHAVW